MKESLIFLRMDEVGLEVGRRLRAARRAAGLTQARVARRAGVARETVYRVERGRLPGIDVATRLCLALGVELDLLQLDVAATDLFYGLPGRLALRERRRSLGLSLATAARAAGVSPATLSRFERGWESSRTLARLNAAGRAKAMINEGLALVLGFEGASELDAFWREAKDRD